MPAMPAPHPATSPRRATGAGDGPTERAGQRPPLVVRPFRGVRYDPHQVSDLAAVTSPPYDVIDPDDASHLEGLDPHNVVRLILPRGGDGDADNRYTHARVVLDEWLAEGVLRRDDAPALYVYEQSGAGAVQRGLIAAVGLHDPADRVVLPHEDVMPGPVADRLELMRATSANLEPILLVYDGAARTAALVDEVCAGQPLVETQAEDGLLQRLWAVTDPAQQDLVATDLAPQQALIADGHHRYATYRRLQAEHHDGGDGAGDWDFGLAMLVDARSHPLRVRAIHRVVADLRLDDAVSLAGQAFEHRPVDGGLDGALKVLHADTGAHPFVLTDGERYALVHDPDPGAVDDVLPPGQHSPDWRALDASVLHALLLDELWDVGDARTSYLHEADAAVRAARRLSGVAVLMRPVTVDVVLSLAARGERMPRKSTSFGPKPRTGLVLRLLER
jgi:uncharacterized protein (DUF1015 family)